MRIAVQIVSKVTGIVAAQKCGAICDAEEMEANLSLKLLSSYQRMRTVQVEHPSVADFDQRVANIQADMDARSRFREGPLAGRDPERGGIRVTVCSIQDIPPMTDTQIVNAIQARIDGQFDQPDLRAVGPLSTREQDVRRILEMREVTK